MSFTSQFLTEARQIIDKLNVDDIEKMVGILSETRATGGRVIVLGVGGGAANASHAVNDLRKIAGIEAYAPTDNVSELTARTNDEGWGGVFSAWLRTSRLCRRDTVFVLSVGGGSLEKNVSPNLVLALQYAKSVRAKIIGIVGRDGGYTAKVAEACVRVPVVNCNHITPHSESFQALVWHLMVSHPALKESETKWEATAAVQEGKAVFLDRDGVIVEATVRDGKPYPPRSLNEMTVVGGAREALLDLKNMGFRLIVVSNQPDVARGTQQRSEVERMHAVLREKLPIDDILVCYHDDRDDCSCRKPRPGLLLQARSRYTLDLKSSFLIGDRWRDIEAGHAAGCSTVLLERGYAERAPAHPPNAQFMSLGDAVAWISNQSEPRR